MVKKRKKIVLIVQARLTSKRFPNKVIQKIGNLTIVELILKRLKKSKLIDEIVFAIPSNKKNEKLYELLKRLNTNIFRGSENNVIDRFFKAAKKFKASTVIRITADAPLVDPKLIDEMILIYKKKKPDYLTNYPDGLAKNNSINDILSPSFPNGFDVEIFSYKLLKLAKQNSFSNHYKEHVTPYFRYSKKFKITLLKLAKQNYFSQHYSKHNVTPHYRYAGKFAKKNIKSLKNLSSIKLSVDEKKDLKKIKKIYKYFYPNVTFSLEDLIKSNFFKKLVKKHSTKETFMKNKIKRGQRLWLRAEKIIPGGNMLLSKNPNRFLPNAWPSYFKSAKGCTITDLDNNKYIDTSIMGVGTNILGYGNKSIDQAVKKTIGRGNLSTLNCPEEVYLSEKLLELHPWFDMVKYARSGGEANSIAIRIARAASGKDNIAICGYHGWHDWYLSANLNSSKEKNLDNHLIKGMSIDGVPKKLKNTVFPFNYGDFEAIKQLVKKQNIGVIKMEVCRNTEPNINFLKKIRNLANKYKIVLIFDECTTGFRGAFGGLHKTISVIPDIAILGKALGNGYAITAVLGKREIMECANNSFISSTFWTERIGPTAALKTLEIMDKCKSWKIITHIGKKIQKRWEEIFDFYNIDVSIGGIPGLSNFIFNSKNHQNYKTLITQEMLKNNFLATNAIYPCTKHSNSILNRYFANLEKVVKIIKICENGSDVRNYLKTDTSREDFKRFN
tara:strand:+ start:66 stop:2246 length:2181 start_codon:yes stop_codon:yes gene_type:complete